jgi:hypothetical protein
MSQAVRQRKIMLTTPGPPHTGSLLVREGHLARVGAGVCTETAIVCASATGRKTHRLRSPSPPALARAGVRAHGKPEHASVDQLASSFHRPAFSRAGRVRVFESMFRSAGGLNLVVPASVPGADGER